MDANTEMNSNGLIRESKGSWKPPTRLQKQAPACLNLDHVSVAFANDIPKAIPLLSPLILSPQPLLEATEKHTRCFDDDQQHNVDHNKSIANAAAAAAGGGWQHPAVPTFTDPSTLFTFFQSQCMIVNPAQ